MISMLTTNKTLSTDINPISLVDNYQHTMQASNPIGNKAKSSALVSLPGFIKETALVPAEKSKSAFPTIPTFVDEFPVKSNFKVPLPEHLNRLLQVSLVVSCVVAILTYSLDVVISRDVTLKQEKARRLSEQNAELSARLLKSISFQGIQKSVLGQGAGPANLHVPDEVLIAREIAPVKVQPFKPMKHHLPLIAGY